MIYPVLRAIAHAAENQPKIVKPAPPELHMPTNKEVAAVNTLTALGARADLSKVSRRYIEGSLVLDMLCNVLRNWARFPDEHSLVITALWIAHTWFTDAEGKLLFPATPRWMAVAPKGCGKTRIGGMVSDMSRDSTGPLSGVVTAPGVRDALDRHLTVVLDEFHKLVGPSGYRRQDLLAYVLAYTPNTGSLNARSDGGKTMSFAPMALLAQPVIEESPAFDDILDRAFVIHPEQAKRGDKIPQLDAFYLKMSRTVARALSCWAAQEYSSSLDDETGLYWPVHEMPEDLDNRAYEISQALISVADRAARSDLTAGDGLDLRWALMAREAVTAMKLGRDEMEDFAADAAKLAGMLAA